MNWIGDQIYTMCLDVKASGTEPKYLYIGKEEYLELRTSIDSRTQAACDIYNGRYMGLELITVDRLSHLMVV